MQAICLEVVGGAIVVEEDGKEEGGGGVAANQWSSWRGHGGGNRDHPLARAVQWHRARAALHGFGGGAAVCVRLRKCHRIGRRGVVLVEIPCEAVAGD